MPPSISKLLRRELLHELFEAQADLRPGQIAVACADKRITYGELEHLANQLARFLRRGGVQRGQAVALLLPRSIDMLLGLLAVLKAGAAYVPLDPDYPEDRVAYILGDCGAHTLITTSALASKRGGFTGRTLCLDTAARAIAAEDGIRLTRAETEAAPEDLCYVIYTSGSTGRPKGVEIEHRSACHLVRTEGWIFQVRPEDRVYQGFSLAFDASVEEIWLAFFSGATLVVGTREMVHAGPDLSRRLAAAGVTVFSCVPTLLAMMEGDVPTLRLLILGGEVCSQDLVTRWCRPGRRMVNTYGPTEATVIVTYVDLAPHKPVTIGRPLPNCQVHLLDPDMKPVPEGAAGELYLGGPGLARGYVGRPDLTAERFVPNPFANAAGASPRLYRTGDLGRLTPEGEIEFLGRADTQVKLRGFRIELTEIEAQLLERPEVLAAAVALREDVPGLPHLVGYVVPRGGAAVDEAAIRTALRRRLPDYMVPALIEPLAELPTLPSGKADRRSLPPPRPRAPAPGSDEAVPCGALEGKIAAVWERLFVPARVSRHDNFFLDFGGHSLLAARMVSELRKDPQLRGLSMLDVYQHPTIASLAAEMQSRATSLHAEALPQSSRAAPGSRKAAHAFCGLLQAGGLYVVLGIFSLQWLSPFLTYTWFIDDHYSRWEALLAAGGVLVVLYPVLLVATIVIKWLVIGRYKPGEYPLWGFYHFRLWLAASIQEAVPVDYLAGTPLMNLYYRAMGATIGSGVHLEGDVGGVYDLLRIGAGSSIGADVGMAGYSVENGRLKVGAITIGERCFVGTRAVLRENTVMEDGSFLEDLSLLPAGATIPRGERWLGSPARPAGPATAVAAAPSPGWGRKFALILLHTLAVIVLPLIVLAAVFPGMMRLNDLNYRGGYYGYLLLSPVMALSFVLFLCVEIAIIKWIILGRVWPGRYPLQSFFYWRKLFVDRLMEFSLDFLGPLYASVYLPPWYRLLGARLGRQVEISTASFISPDLLSMDDESFIADSVSLGASRVEGGFLTLGENRLGKRSFVGNSALLPPGAVIAENGLIGCLSVPPAGADDAAREGATWLGSPAFLLPKRQEGAAFSEVSTFRPSHGLQLQRAMIELLRVILPATGFIMFTSLLLSITLLIRKDLGLCRLLLLFPLLYAGCGLLAVLYTCAAKWLLVGRYRAGERPLWCGFVWRNEVVNALHEHFAGTLFVNHLAGTPFLCWYFRLLGAKIGKRVFMQTTDLTEFDLVSVGDDAALNDDCTLQTHLFEDRVMKVGRVDIGPRCRVGSSSLVLYDTRMEEGAALDSLSLLMKGETLPAQTRWRGIPARAIDEPPIATPEVAH